MTQVQQDVCGKLGAMGAAYEITEHPAVYTIEEMESLGITLKGDVAKNLFLRDAKGKRHFLVVLDKDKKADLKELQHQLGSTKLSFASEERLGHYLGLSKGAVSPLGVLNDTENAVEVVFDADLKGRERIGVHPNENTATLWLSFESLEKVMEQTGHTIQFVTLS